jgi:hypothetical protein
MHLVAVPTSIATTKVQRLVHVSGEMDEELERLESGVGRCGAGDKGGQDGADVLYGVEDVGAIGARPAVRAGELAVVWRVVAHAFGVVQWGGPVRPEADLVGPGGDGREVARRVAIRERRPSVSASASTSAAAIAVRTEDGADGGQDLGDEVRLGEGSDDFVAF